MCTPSTFAVYIHPFQQFFVFYLLSLILEWRQLLDTNSSCVRTLIRSVDLKSPWNYKPVSNKYKQHYNHLQSIISSKYSEKLEKSLQDSTLNAHELWPLRPHCIKTWEHSVKKQGWTASIRDAVAMAPVTQTSLKAPLMPTGLAFCGPVPQPSPVPSPTENVLDIMNTTKVTLDCWATEVLHQELIGKNSNPQSFNSFQSAGPKCLLGVKMGEHSGKHAPVPAFLEDVPGIKTSEYLHWKKNLILGFKSI